MAQKWLTHNDHHIVWQNSVINCEKTKWLTVPDNIIRMAVPPHDALHTLFSVKNHPIAHMQELFNLTSTVLIDDVKNELQKTLEVYEALGIDVYKKEVVRRK